MTTALPMKWSEIDDDDVNVDDYAGFVDVAGDVKTLVNFAETAEGMTKIITKKKVRRKVDRRSGIAAARKELMNKLAENSEESYTSHPDKEIFIELPRNMRKIEDDNDGYPEKPIQSGLGVWKDSVRDKFNQLRMLDGEKLNERDWADIQQEESTATQVPMITRGEMGRGTRPMRDDCIVRVTNLSEETTEDDLNGLFGKIGKVERIFLAKDKDTRISKGYAFITYTDRQSAQNAIQKLDRHGHDSLLLRVEWAKPSSKSRD